MLEYLRSALRVACIVARPHTVSFQSFYPSAMSHYIKGQEGTASAGVWSHDYTSLVNRHSIGGRGQYQQWTSVSPFLSSPSHLPPPSSYVSSPRIRPASFERRDSVWSHDYTADLKPGDILKKYGVTRENYNILKKIKVKQFYC